MYVNVITFFFYKLIAGEFEYFDFLNSKYNFVLFDRLFF